MPDGLNIKCELRGRLQRNLDNTNVVDGSRDSIHGECGRTRQNAILPRSTKTSHERVNDLNATRPHEDVVR